MILKQSIYDIYNKGIENRKSVDKIGYSNKRNLKVAIYYLTALILSPISKEESINSVLLVNGPSQHKWKPIVNAQVEIHRGESDLKHLKSHFTFFMLFNRGNRIRLWVEATRAGKKHGIPKEEKFAWLEFYFLYSLFSEGKIKTVITRGHYDDISTWISLLSELFGINYIIYQHGVVSEAVNIPNKIFCTEFYGFDNYSINLFRSRYIKNQDCKYKVHEFPPSVDFKDIEKEQGELLIGIAEQINAEWVQKVVRSLEVLGKTKIIIMKHPLSTISYDLDNCIVGEEKIGNIDVLITESSTLALDYYRYNPNIKVVYTSESVLATFGDYPFIYCNDLKKLADVICEVSYV